MSLSRCLVQGLMILAGALVASSAFGQADQVTSARAAVSKDRTSTSAALTLGRVLRRAGIFAAAATELRRGARLPSARSGEVAISLRRELARVYIDQSSYSQAMQVCREIGRIAAGKAMSHACLAEAYMIRKRATQALPELEKALELEPSLYEARVIEGHIRWMLGEAASAERAFQAAIKKDGKRVEGYLGLGGFHEAHGRKAEARAAYGKAVAADGTDPIALFLLGRSLAPGPNAIATLERAIVGRPSFGPAHAALASALLKTSSLDRAEQEGRLALRSSPVRAGWHALLGEILVRRGQPDAALAAASQTLRLIPNDAHAMLVRADAQAAKGDIDLAIESYQSAFSFRRSDPTALVRGARACMNNARETTAKGFTDRATSLFPTWGPAWEAAGDVNAKAGDKAGARRAYERALRSKGPVDKARVRRKIGKLK